MSASTLRAKLVSFFMVFLAGTAFGAAPAVLNIGNGPDIKTVDPHLATGIYEHNVIMQLFDGLVDTHPKTLEPIPGAAESWKISKDGLTYTFKLRKNGKWSNGEPVTAQDFVNGLVRLLTPATAAENAYQAFYIVNAEAFNKGEKTNPADLGMKALDATTLEIKLNSPTPFFLGLLNHYAFYPIHKATIEKHGDRWTRPENIVNNGAFKLVSWELNKNIKMQPNPHYYDLDKVKLTEVNFVTTENMDTEEKMFRTGQLHVTNWVAPEKLPIWQKDTSGQFVSAPWLGTYYFVINNKRFTDPRVRKALGYGIDRERFTKYVTKGNEAPLLSATPPGTGGFTPPSGWPKDGSRIAEAKKLLAEAGYNDQKKLVVELVYNTEERHKKIAEALQAMWKENLGVEAKLLNQEWKVFLNTRKTLSYDVARYGWIADYNDPLSFLLLFKTGYGQNETGFSNPKFDALMVQAEKERNSKKRMEIFRKAENILAEEGAFIPLYVQTKNFLVSKKVVGWYPNIQNIRRVKWVSLAN